MPEYCDVAVVGGGVIGCAVALHLAQAGSRVIIVDGREKLGLGASDAAMGGILTQTESACLGPLSRVIRRSRDLYLSWLDGIIARAGVDVPILNTGDIQVALDDTEMERLDREVVPLWMESPFKVRRLTAEEARDLEPKLSPEVRGGFLLPEELALDPRELMTAMRAALANTPGVSVSLGSPAVRVDSTPAGAVAELSDGTRIEAGTIVVSAGYEAGKLLPQLGDRVFPIKGEAFDLRPPGATTYPLGYHVFAEITLEKERGFPYFVPRHDGRVAVGVTYEEKVADASPTPEGLASIRRWMTALLPDSADWPMTRHWGGLRPASPDHIPIIGHVDDHRRLVAATGHSGLGITLAPVTATLVSALIADQIDVEAADHLAICSPTREAVKVAASPAPTAH